MATDAVIEQAFAKVNLCLHVLGQRPDGYHLLDSMVAFAGIGDRLTACPAGASALQCEGPFGTEIPDGEDNLILRAARATAPGHPTLFTLEKTLPPASGIGGGSADAAAAVRALLRLYPGIPRPDLLQLGADVPVCFASRAARMRGIGERLDPVPALPQGWILLANPRVEVPTPAVFRALTCRQNPPLPDTLPAWPDLPALARWLSSQRNDLQPAAEALAPQITETLAALAAQPGHSLTRMSGSGATCFALFAEEAAARTAETRLGAAQPRWWVRAGPLLP